MFGPLFRLFPCIIFNVSKVVWSPFDRSWLIIIIVSWLVDSFRRSVFFVFFLTIYRISLTYRSVRVVCDLVPMIVSSCLVLVSGIVNSVFVTYYLRSDYLSGRSSDYLSECSSVCWWGCYRGYSEFQYNRWLSSSDGSNNFAGFYKLYSSLWDALL